MAISYLSLDGFIDCFFFPLSLAPILDKKSFPLHFIRGYWRHVGLTWHICFIISCPGMIMVIDTVTPPPPRHQCLPCWAPGCVRCDVCVCVCGHSHSGRYHGRLMGVNCRGASTYVYAVYRSCGWVAWGGGGYVVDCWLSFPLWTNKPAVCVITSTRSIHCVHHTC